MRATPAEEAREDLSVQAQRGRLEAHARNRGWNLVAVHEDTGPSADIGAMPSLRRLIDQPDAIDKLVVVRLDRLGRRARRVNRLLRPLLEAGVDLVALDEEIDTGTESGRLVPGLLTTMERWEPQETSRDSDWHPDRLRSDGFQPATVIDVGAGVGTRPLLEAFPGAHHVLIEPLTEFGPHLKVVMERYDAEWLQTAVGAREGTIALRVDQWNPFTSSVLPTVQDVSPSETREVPLTTLDTLLESRRWKQPLLLKLDAEGFEHEVVAGAERLLGSADRVVAEVSISPRFQGSLSCAEFIVVMGGHGFEVRDIIDAARSPLGAHADLIFSRRPA